MARSKKRVPKSNKSTQSARSPEAAKVSQASLQLPYLRGLVAKSTLAPLTATEQSDLSASIETLAWLMALIANKDATLTRMRRALFGNGTESMENLLAILGSQEKVQEPPPSDEYASPEEAASGAAGVGSEGGQEPTSAATPAPAEPKPLPKGHGRNGARHFTGAKRCPVSHPQLKRGELCPECQTGRVYPLSMPSVLVRIEGIGPLVGTIYELERLRCNGCGRVFTATPPEGVGTQKYDHSVTALIALLRYGCGMPFHRLSRLQSAVGLPLPESTAFELVEAGADALEALYEALMWEAAQGQTLHNDDTRMRILKAPEPLEPADGKDRSERTGLFTTGLLSETGGHRVALYITGRQHAGENLKEVLLRRAEGLGPPIQMSDALAHNKPVGIDTLMATCLAHARRNFFDVAEHFPDEVRKVLELLGRVYHAEAQARREGLSPEARLLHHQAHSAPVMAELRTWMTQQLDDREVEPNSGLGQAMNYMLKRWDTFTVFLRFPGVPLDNNVAERALKRAILHRRNSLFFKTWNGARVGDLYMSLIHTCELEQQDPFAYLKAVLQNASQVEADPSAWLPWTWRATLDTQTPTPAAHPTT